MHPSRSHHIPSIRVWQILGLLLIVCGLTTWWTTRATWYTFTPVRALALSPDGQMLATAESQGHVRLRRMADGHVLHTLTAVRSVGAVTSVAFSPDGQLLAAGTRGPDNDAYNQRVRDDAAVKLWRVSDGQLLATLWGNTESVETVTFSPDGHVLAAGGLSLRDIGGSWLVHDSPVFLWRVPDGSLLGTISGLSSVESLAFHPSGEFLAADQYVLHVGDRSILRQLPAQSMHINAVAFSPDGQFLAAADSNATVKVWQVKDWSLRYTFTGHTDQVLSIAWSPDGQLLASGSGITSWEWSIVGDQTICLWQMRDGQLQRRFRAHTDRIEGLVFSLDGDFVVSGSSDQTIKFWSVR